MNIQKKQDYDLIEMPGLDLNIIFITEDFAKQLTKTENITLSFIKIVKIEEMPYTREEIEHKRKVADYINNLDEFHINREDVQNFLDQDSGNLINILRDLYQKLEELHQRLSTF